MWIALRSRENDYAQWQGTYLRIEANGKVTRVTRDDNYPVDDEFVIRKGDKK